MRKRRFEIDVLLVSSVVTLGIGLFAPILTFKKLIFFKSSFSIFSGLVSLFEQGEYILFFIVFTFSVLFPMFKLILLSFIWYSKSWPREKLRKYLHYHGILSKWSMLDVFVVAILVVVIRLGILGKVEVHAGIYIFASSILLSTVATSRLYHLFSKEEAGVIARK